MFKYRELLLNRAELEYLENLVFQDIQGDHPWIAIEVQGAIAEALDYIREDNG